MCEDTVAIPVSIISDTPHLREKTAKLGSIARSCSIFGVDEVIVYADDLNRNQKHDLNICMEILRFLETPQYLRKRLFSLGPDLRYVGILPPLQIPTHNVPRTVQECMIGDLREGVITARSGDNLKVDVGLESLAECQGRLAVGTRTTVKLTSTEKLAGKLIDRTKISIPQRNTQPPYWGYKVGTSTSLGRLLQSRRFDLKVGTSRYGSSFTEVWTPFLKSVKNANSVLIAYGSPRMGLREILQQEKLAVQDLFNYLVNMVRDQKTLTVRTEEALLASLSILNLARALN
jgi:predicted SPOUT superfamily RNA methylase MTH1